MVSQDARPLADRADIPLQEAAPRERREDTAPPVIPAQDVEGRAADASPASRRPDAYDLYAQIYALRTEAAGDVPA